MSGIEYTKRVASTIEDVLLSKDCRLDFDSVQQNINLFVLIYQDDIYKAMFNIKSKLLKILRYFECKDVEKHILKASQSQIKEAKIKHGLRYSFIENLIWVEISMFINWAYNWNNNADLPIIIKAINQLNENFAYFSNKDSKFRFSKSKNNKEDKTIERYNDAMMSMNN